MNNVKNSISFEDLLKTNHKKKFIINKKYHWIFLDEYTFSIFKKECNSPSYFSEADGNVSFEGNNKIAKIVIFKHDDLNILSGSLYLKKSMSNKEWKSMVNITSIEEEP